MALPPGALPVTPEIEAQLRGKTPTQGATSGVTMSQVDTTGGAPLSLRYAGGKQFDTAGVGRYLKSKLGDENVLPVMSANHEVDNFMFREGPQGQWMTYDPEATGIISAIKDIPGDIADVSGDIIEAGAQGVGFAAGALIGSAAGPVGTAIGGVAGGYGTGILANAERQAEVRALPGGQEIPWAERINRALMAGGEGVLGEGLGGIAAKAVKGAIKTGRKLRPRFRNAQGFFDEKIPRGAQEALSDTGPTGAEWAEVGGALESRLTKEMGGDPVKMSVAQLTESRKAAGFENILRTAVETTVNARAVDLDAARQLGRGMDTLVERVSKGEISGQRATGMLGGAYNTIRTNLIDTMRADDAVNFGKVALATKGGKLFSAKPLLDFVDSASSGMSNPTAAEKYAKGLVEDILKTSSTDWAHAKGGAPVITARQMQSILRSVGKKVGEGESIDMPVSIGGIKASARLNKTETQQIAKGLFRSLQSSLDEAIEAAAKTPDALEARTVATALREARASHRAAMEGLEASEKSFGELAIGLADKDQASLGPKRLLSKTPEEIDSLMVMLRKTPEGAEAADKMSGASLRQIIEESTKEVPEGAIVSPAVLSSRLNKYKKHLGKMVGEQDKQFMEDLGSLAMRLRRVDVFGGMSQTANLEQAIKVTPGKAGLIDVGVKVANKLARAMRILQSPEGMFRALNDPHQRKIMLKLVGPRAYDRPIEVTSKMVSRLLGIQADKAARDNPEYANKIIEALMPEQNQ